MVLSDPAFCSNTQSGGLMGPTDVGTRGINDFFFEVHKECTDYCVPDAMKSRPKTQ